MTDFVFDRSFSTEGTSSVIDEVFYSSDERKLAVQLTRTDWNGNPVLAGYEDVPADVFTALEVINNNRLNGDENSSVGSYWNTWIKPHFMGFPTTDLDLVDAEEEAKNASVVEDKAPAEEVPVQVVGDNPFLVHWNDDVVEEDSSILIYAGSIDQALVIFNQIAKIAGWGVVKIRAVTQIFNS